MVSAVAGPLVTRHVGVVVGATIGSSRVVSRFAGPGQIVPGDDAIFQIGSITKVFTALALADAVTSGELSLETPLAALLPIFPRPNASSITLGQLASHTSGLPRLPAAEVAGTGDPRRPVQQLQHRGPGGFTVGRTPASRTWNPVAVLQFRCRAPW